MNELVRFWLLFEVIALLGVPTAAVLFHRLPGRGLALARPLALLIIIYPLWLLASLHMVPYTATTAPLGLAILTACGGAAMVFQLRSGSWRQLQGEPVRIWIVSEIIWTVAFAGLVTLRAYAPDVWGTEKPMDMAFINAINRSPWFPPHDPWMSGSTINYYYFGHFVMAWLIRMTGVWPWYGFNLDVSAVYALCCSTAFATGSALAVAARDEGHFPVGSAIGAGIFSAALAMLFGNLDGAVELLAKPVPLIQFDWWSPSRVIANTINEFPFFSFLLADLHAHMMAVPFDLLCLGFSIQLAFGGLRLLSPRGLVQTRSAHRADNRGGSGLSFASLLSMFRSPAIILPQPRTIAVSTGTGTNLAPVPAGEVREPRSPDRGRSIWLDAHLVGGAGELLWAGVMYGVLYALNGWDFPTQLGIGVIALIFWWWRFRHDAAPAVLVATILAWGILSVALFLPFYLHFLAPEGGIGLVTNHDGLLQYLHDYTIIYGVFIWIFGSAYVYAITHLPLNRSQLLWTSLVVAVTAVLLAPLHIVGPLLILGSCAFAFSQAVNGDKPQSLRLWWFLVGTAIGLVSVGEVVYLRDVFAGTVDYRMNTVFKFGFQAWLVFSVICGPAVFWSRSWMRQSSRGLWIGVLTVLLLAASVYTVAGTISREDGFTAEPTLNGLRWLAERSPGDVAAIKWLQTHVAGSPVIAEAVGVQYDPSGHARVSTFTGLPTVIGWPGHEVEWGHDPGQRAADVKTLYSTTSLPTAQAIINKYDIAYVFVGSLERADYAAAGLAKFVQLGQVVFSDGGVTIYSVSAHK